MSYLTVKQFSEKWGISERRIINLCRENRINGAIKNGMIWNIPEDTIKPYDKRSNISQYIKTKKSAIVININNEIGYNLIPLLEKEGYSITGIYENNIDKEKYKSIKVLKTTFNNQIELLNTINNSEKYYDGLIIIDKDGINKQCIIEQISKKMNCDSSIVLVNNNQNKQDNLEKKLSKKLKEDIGLTINAINLSIPENKNIIIDYSQVAEDIVTMLTKFRNTTGSSIITDCGYIELDENNRTKDLEIGKFYKIINNYFKKMEKGDMMWSVSTMLEDEWTEEPAEINFKVNNLDAANRGAILERLFIFSKEKIEEFKNNKTLKLYMENHNINTMFVDYDEIIQKEPYLLEIVKDGWDGFGLTTLIVDLPINSKVRGYLSLNKQEIERAYNCFLKLKNYSKDLRKVLK